MSKGARKQLLSDFVVVLVFAAIAFGIHAFGEHLADKTRALRTKGVAAEVVVIRVLRGLPRKVVVAYHVGGVPYEVEVFAPSPAPVVSERLTGVFSPDAPGRIRIRPLDEASIEEDRAPFRHLPLLFLAPIFILVVARVARLAGCDPMRAVGAALGVVLVCLIISVNFFDGVRAVIADRFGPHVLGLPSHLAVSLAQLFVLGPLLMLWGRAALELSSLAAGRGVAVGRLAFIPWVLTSDDARTKPGARRQFLLAGSALIAILIAAIVLLSATD